MRQNSPPLTPWRQLSNSRLWLTPGMGVKRHVGLAVVGALILVSGATGTLLWTMQGSRQTISEPIEAVLVSERWQVWGGWLSFSVLLLGIGVAAFAIARLNRSLLSNWLSHPGEAAVVIHRRVSLAKGPRIVALGGGTGLSNLLRGLRQHTSNITAVVAVSDDGGSSGRLRAAFDMPAPGDLVDCLAALSDNELQVSKLLDYRYTRGGELKGHTFGNLFITTLTEVEGDFARAIRVLNALLNLCGAVYPVSTEAISLRATKRSGRQVVGESQLRDVEGPIETVSIEPAEPKLVPDVALAVGSADLIVLGPGSLFSSTIPPLLVPEGRTALQNTAAPIVYVCNIMTEAGETDGFDAWEHVRTLYRHVGRYPDYVLVNAAPLDKARLERYREENADVVTWSPEPFTSRNIKLIPLDLLGDGPHAQHDTEMLAQWLAELAKARPQRDDRSHDTVLIEASA